MDYKIRIGSGTVTFDVIQDLVAARPGARRRGGARAAGSSESLLISSEASRVRELNAFMKAGWAIGKPASSKWREQAEPTARGEGVELHEVLLDGDHRYYIDSGNVVVSLFARDLADAADKLNDDGLTIVRRLPIGSSQFIERGGHTLLARVRGERPTLKVVEALQDAGRYQYVEPDLIEHIGPRQHWRCPDPDYYLQWHLENTGHCGGDIGADIRAPGAWSHTRGRGVRIAIVDSGFELDHPALEHAVGWGGYFGPDDQFLLRQTGTYPASTHGTSCAGIALARSGSGSGGCGIANEAEFMPIACLYQETGSQETLALALTYAALPDRSGRGTGVRGADVIVCSLGPHEKSWPMTSTLSAAIDTVVTEGRDNRGCVLVWAASNANVSIERDQVASDRRVLAVGRTTKFDHHDFTAWGDGLDFVAPGVAVYTTVDGAGWGFETGCSFAAPLVAGVAGLILSRDPDLTRDQVVDRLRSTCRKIGGSAGGYKASGHSPRYGYGCVNSEAAVR